MEPSHKLILALAVLIIIVGAGLWVTFQALPKTQAPTPVPTPSPTIPVFYLGQEIQISSDKLAMAAALLADLATTHPDRWGIIPETQAPNEVRILLAQTAQALANFSAVDLACETIVHATTPCEDVQKQYQLNHEGFPSHVALFPADEGYTCEAIRARVPTPELALSGPCTEPSATGQRAHLCAAIAARDCNQAYEGMIQDYTYTELGLSAQDSRFCELVSDPTLRSGCIAGDKDTARKDLERSYID